MFAFASLLALAASAAALQVTQPSNSSGWTTSGPNTVTWSSVSTDNSNFSIVLNNQNTYPQYNEVLEALIQTSEGSVAVNPPSGGWVAGTGYRVNFVKNSQDLSSLLAQSDDFTIEQSSSSTFSAVPLLRPARPRPLVPCQSPQPAPPPLRRLARESASNTDSSAGSSASSASGSSSSTNAAPGLNVQTGVYGLLALLGIALA
ncbi:uncharacterized protein B0H18DRAFT_1112525 [Fomitopsis serialis]|uniref:uncharacterized protein n=1 Tax=Fomitopsis serialis TaxID=139415 RepID=UPI002008E59F|nr:uncharacterized protein B0H18DRAFT_1112525 [Neoantrodia serialis]KAH9938356.1 hypothetical protein B0H18DRAFT_1112525 [Neoantrodia serialis]